MKSLAVRPNELAAAMLDKMSLEDALKFFPDSFIRQVVLRKIEEDRMTLTAPEYLTLIFGLSMAYMAFCKKIGEFELSALLKTSLENAVKSTLPSGIGLAGVEAAKDEGGKNG